MVSSFILAGFELAIENEQDSTRTHAEFIATKGGRSPYSVEAKTRTPQKPNYDVGNQLYKALKIDAEHPRFVFIDTNIGRDIDLERFGAEVTSALTGRESKLTISGDPNRGSVREGKQSANTFGVMPPSPSQRFMNTWRRRAFCMPSGFPPTRCFKKRSNTC